MRDAAPPRVDLGANDVVKVAMDASECSVSLLACHLVANELRQRTIRLTDAVPGSSKSLGHQLLGRS